jgi:hypothetical protein
VAVILLWRSNSCCLLLVARLFFFDIALPSFLDRPLASSLRRRPQTDKP